jgi:hypothetical protein
MFMNEYPDTPFLTVFDYRRGKAEIKLHQLDIGRDSNWVPSGTMMWRARPRAVAAWHSPCFAQARLDAVGIGLYRCVRLARRSTKLVKDCAV